MALLKSGRVAVVLKGYPRLSETFIAQEIAALERRGLELMIVSLRHPTDRRTHAVHAEIRAPKLYLPEYLYTELRRVLGAWWRVRTWPSYRKARAHWWRDFARDPTTNRIRRFGQALVLADELPRDIGRLHVHFLHTPASVTRYAALLRGLPWSASAHAKDIWTTPEWEKREKLSACEWLVTCTAANRDHLAALAPAGKVELVYHGLDFTRFPSPPGRRPPRDGRNPSDPVVILSVGRLVEKKGMDLLLEALARLPSMLHWRFVHVGGGPLRDALEGKAQALGIADRITWRGALPQDEVLQEYRAADIFALASRIASDGDRDGLPNVLVEAQSQALPCVATNVSAIPELIRDGVSGLLVGPDSPEGFARALESCITDPARRAALGEAGRARVRADFDLDDNLDRLAEKFGLAARRVATKLAATG
jgi:glycosyltransferase involved in cell wall biosynthesis